LVGLVSRPRIAVYVTALIKRRAEVAAARRGKSLSDWVADLISSALEGEPE